MRWGDIGSLLMISVVALIVLATCCRPQRAAADEVIPQCLHALEGLGNGLDQLNAMHVQSRRRYIVVGLQLGSATTGSCDGFSFCCLSCTCGRAFSIWGNGQYGWHTSGMHNPEHTSDQD
jgi:hypothetical protein